MNRDAAEALSVSVLGWMATDDERLMAFLGASGASVEDLRTRAQDPDFLGFILDFLLQDEATLIAFCDHEGLDYDAPARARAALPGGDLPHWT
ncbi:MAG: DUF3572 domain-containing protein [Pseudomonadota bacterium]